LNVNILIIDTLSPVVPNDTPDEANIKLNKYSGTSETYVTFNYEDDRATHYEDNEPKIDTAFLQIHLFCPADFNYNTLKKQIRSKLYRAGFSYPQITGPFYEDETGKNHIVFQCQIDGQSETEE
jgi:hypothetical protein